MENYTPDSNPSYLLKNKTSKKILQTSYRGFVSIDQEMEREIAMEFFNASKKTICSQKGFLFEKS